MLIPLLGFVRGDTLGVIVLAQHDEAVAVVAERLAQAAGVRVAPSGRPALVHDGVRLAPERTVEQHGLRPLDRVDLLGGDA